MEFLKHRQRVVAEAFVDIKKPTEQKFPPFLDRCQPSLMMKKDVASAVGQYKKVQARIERIIENPSSNDEVFKSLNRIFKHDGPFCLSRNTDSKNRIRSLARKRFSLGYPPRKQGDTSIGDALNWEWIIDCCLRCPDKSNVIIVSRDGDYGTTRGQKSILNDWLKKEFQERVSRKRKIELTELLSYAFKMIDVTFSRSEVEEERQIVNEPRNDSFSTMAPGNSVIIDPGNMKNVTQKMERIREVFEANRDELENLNSFAKFFADLKKGQDQ